MRASPDVSVRRATRLDLPLLNQVAVIGAAAAIVLLHLVVHVAKWPDFEGWWAGFDQRAYLTAAQAWAAGDLTPNLHHYLAGYPLLAAPFVGLLPAQPFVVADLVCALLSLFLLVAIARRLVPDEPWAPSMAALAFLLATMSSRAAISTWVVPWSTTPAVPLILGALLCTLRYIAAARLRDAVLAGMAGALVGAIRPADAALLLASLGPVLAWAAYRHRLGAGRFLGHASGFAAGAAIPVGVLVALHVLVHGWAPGAYLAGSAAMGFEPWLIPQRWVLLALNPQPVFGDAAGSGMVLAFPWIVPGIAGLVAGLLSRGRQRHLAAGLAVLGTWLLYLAFRDLHPTSLWRYFNHHYFKWTHLILAFYALWWLRLLARGVDRRRALAGLAVAALLLPWRASLKPMEAVTVPVSRAVDGAAFAALPFSLALPAQGALVTASGPWDGVPAAVARLVPAGPGWPRGTLDIGAYPVPGGVLILPLRPLPDEPATLSFGPAVLLRAEERARPVRLVLRPGIPWWPAGATGAVP
jgi:hypothetical protein